MTMESNYILRAAPLRKNFHAEIQIVYVGPVLRMMVLHTFLKAGRDGKLCENALALWSVKRDIQNTHLGILNKNIEQYLYVMDKTENIDAKITIKNAGFAILIVNQRI